MQIPEQMRARSNSGAPRSLRKGYVKLNESGPSYKCVRIRLHIKCGMALTLSAFVSAELHPCTKPKLPKVAQSSRQGLRTARECKRHFIGLPFLANGLSGFYVKSS